MSLRRRIFNFGARMFIKPLLRYQTDPIALRKQFARSARSFRTPPFTLILPEAHNGGLHVSCGKVHPTRLLFYIHGGGFIAGSPETHSPLVARLSRLTGMRAYLPRYPLAPEATFPAAFNAVCAAWDKTVSQGYQPQNIVIGGDSAGGGLALALLAHLCAKGTPPRALFAFSPLTDFTFSGASITENRVSEVFFPAERVGELREMVQPAGAPTDPRISPLNAAFPDCPPVYLQASGSEILRDDSLRMAAHLREHGAEARAEIWSDLPHVWQLFDGYLPEARAALTATAKFTLNQWAEPADS